MKTFENFTGLYSLSKTLRFELKPIGKTKENIERNGLISQDEHRAESYKKVKKIIDEYHKAYIDSALYNFKLNFEDEGLKNSLKEFYFYYQLPRKEESEKSAFEAIQKNLRKQIAEALTKSDAYKRIDKKELIKEDLIEFVKTIEDRQLVEEFKDFTTYFTGFHQNRQNMYSDEAKSTAIAYRLIHENLPKFIDNISVFEKVAHTSVAENFSILYKQMEEYLNVLRIEDLFKLNYYTEVLTQRQIGVYNAIIGGKTTNNGEKIQGLNEHINLYNQQQKDKNDRLPKLKPLYKQILSDREAISWLPEEFQNDNETLQAIGKTYTEIDKTVLIRNENDEISLKELLQNLEHYDLDKIYIANDLQLTDISQKLFGNWNAITKFVIEKLKTETPKKPKETEETYNERIAKLEKSQKSYSIGYLNECLQNADKTEKIQNYFTGLGAINSETEQKENLFARVENNFTEVKSLLENPYSDEKNLAQEKTDVENIKNLLDALKELQYFIKPLLGKGNEQSDKDETFYGEFSRLWDDLDIVTPLYNMVRNYMTRKPYSTEKFKLNFENSYFLSGWATDYETKAGLIFEQNGLFYLGINNKKLSNEDKHKLIVEAEQNPAKRIILDFQKPDNKNIPRLFIRSKGENYAPAVEKYKLPISEIIDIYDNGKFKTEYKKNNANDYYQSLYKLIDYFKKGFSEHESYKHYSFAWKETSQYNDIAEFYHDVEVSCYQIKTETVNWDTVNQFVDKGKLYLFQIYNKDFSTHSKGTPNMHTLYWKMLFDERNLADVVYKLNGQAEIFFRKSSIKDRNKVVHLAKNALDNKNNDNQKKQSVFDYDIVKDRRYTMDKFQFHVPITMNFKGSSQNSINGKTNEYIKQSNDLHIIGIDRGERHLLYLSVVDMQGNIKEQYSLNQIINEYNGNTYRTNYRDLLNKREDERDKARKSWQTIENIKDLKEGYLSQVIHKISQLMIKYNAIVTLEDLNFGFKRGRQKVEKQVYQKFEKMLIDKLNYFADKTLNPSETGGILKAYQLTSKFESFQKLGKQSGFLFYVPAWNTSKMDPVTGFVNLFDTRYESIEKAKAFFGKFDRISYNNEKQWFEFAFDYDKFTTKAEGTRTVWTLCTHGTRIKTSRNPEKNNMFDSVEFDLTTKFKNLFNDYQININGNLKDAVANQEKKDFFENLLGLLRFTLQMRNSITNSNTDYMISPVADKNGIFYNSRTCGKTLPENADANGAYNIARKGIWIINQIKTNDNDKKLNLDITNKQWLQFVQQNI